MKCKMYTVCKRVCMLGWQECGNMDYAGCFMGNLPCFRTPFLRLNSIDIKKNSYI